MDPTLVPGTRFEFQFQICVYEHAILRIYISFFPTIGIAQLVVGTTSNGYLSSWSQVRAHGGERNPCELGG